jgi:hypothetical protein
MPSQYVLGRFRAAFAGVLTTAGQQPARTAVTALAICAAPVLVYLMPAGELAVPRIALFLSVPVALLVPSRYLGLALVPLWTVSTIIPFGSPFAEAATVAFVLGTAFGVVSKGVRPHWAYLLLGLFGAVLTASLVYPSVAGVNDLSSWSNLLGVLTGLTATAAVIVEPPAPRAAAGAVVVSGALVACLVLSDGVLISGRLVAPGFNPNSVGAIVAVPIVAAVALARFARQPLWLLIATPCAVALARSESRGALISAVAGTVYALACSRRWWPKLLVAAGLAVGLVLAAGPISSLVLSSRPVAELDVNNQARAKALRLAFQLALEHPIRGIGYGMFPSQAAGAPSLGIYMNTHNEYAHLASEAGVMAVALFLALIGWAMLRRLGRDASVLHAVAITYATGLLFGDFIANMPISVVFWLAVGCLLGYRRIEKTVSPGAPVARQPAGHRPRSLLVGAGSGRTPESTPRTAAPSSCSPAR